MKRIIFLLQMSVCAVALADVRVKSVEAHQRYPWNGLVDIVVTIEGASNDVAEADCFFAATNTATQTALPVAHITHNGSDSGSGVSWTRRFIWDAAADVGAVKIDDVALTVDAQVLDYVQLWENGPYWAKCNVGASKPEEYGYYFWWGDTVGYKRNTNDDGWASVANGTSFAFSSGNCPTYLKYNNQLEYSGYVDWMGNLEAVHDAARAHLGAPWRMPKDSEFSALIDNCTKTWALRNGVYGWLVTGKGAYALKSIFLPAAGYGYDPYFTFFGRYGLYWSSTLGSSTGLALGLCFSSKYHSRSDYGSRYYGRSVRPLRTTP